MSGLQIYAFQDQMIRTAGTFENPWFCLPDTCKILGLGNVSQVASRLKPQGLTLFDGFGEFRGGITTNEGGVISNEGGVTTNDGISENTSGSGMLFADQPNFFRCIFTSRKEKAVKFQDWVFEDLLPQVCRTGKYSVSDEFLDSPEQTVEVSKETLLLSHQQMMDQSLAMHRASLALNKFTHADKFAEKLSSPKHIAELRDAMVSLGKENIDLKHEVLNLLEQAVDTVSRQQYNRRCADYELAIDALERQLEMFKYAAKEADRRSDEYQSIAKRALPPATSSIVKGRSGRR